MFQSSELSGGAATIPNKVTRKKSFLKGLLTDSRVEETEFDQAEVERLELDHNEVKRLKLDHSGSKARGKMNYFAIVRTAPDMPRKLELLLVHLTSSRAKDLKIHDSELVKPTTDHLKFVRLRTLGPQGLGTYLRTRDIGSYGPRKNTSKSTDLKVQKSGDLGPPECTPGVEA
ncbi:hypothetical protein WH47_02042 [Habropoda laboriosa]|uniref:Uncharacterized protein n=1 Tax=Habropoda laboriosa TaxID=597456 RepID=A0A0L7QZI9_9HYME|nr:hypothetical protein WH47_02042 [Habropoda laboriosa]